MTVSYGQPPYARSLLNHNRLLSLYGDAIGVKTGFTKKAGRCLVSAAEKDGVRLICVTLNCPDDWNTHAALYQRYFALTESRPLTLEAPILPVVGGQKAALQTVLVGQPTYTAIRGPGGGHHRHRLPKPRLLLRPGGSRPTAGPGGMAPRGPCHWHRRPRRRGEHPRPRIPPSLVAKAIWVALFRKKGPCHPAGTSALSYYLPQRGNELIHRLRLGGPAGAQPQRHPALPAPLLIVGAARPQGIGLLLA